jgi:hypothetical protein
MNYDSHDGWGRFVLDLHLHFGIYFSTLLELNKLNILPYIFNVFALQYLRVITMNFSIWLHRVLLNVNIQLGH